MNALGGWENVFRYGAELILGGACLFGTAGIGAVACATGVNIGFGTAFNVLDAAMAGGITGPNPDTNWKTSRTSWPTRDSRHGPG